jgi:hypothetical protein
MSTKFSCWVLSYGIDNLAKDLGQVNPGARCTPRSVRHWLKGSHEPRRERIRGIVKIASGEVTTDDVLMHFDKFR